MTHIVWARSALAPWKASILKRKSTFFFNRAKQKGNQTETKRILLSPVDSDARLSVKHDERGRFASFGHSVVDSMHNFIIDTHVTSANIPGHKVLLNQLDS